MYALKDDPRLDTPPAPDPASACITVRDLSAAYREGELALQHVTFAVQSGESVAIIGPNGAGKSTLIKAIMGFLAPASGTIELAGNLRERLGYVPQHEGIDWDFPATVREAVLMARTRHIGWLRRAGRAEWQAVDRALERVGLAALAHRQIGALSGGQRRRVFIARALAQEAAVLLLDEPFSGVDAAAQDGLLDVLDSLHADGMTILLTTHDLGLAFRRFQKVLALRSELIAYGPPQAVYRPDVLSRLYGGQLAAWQDGRQVLVFVDDHHCADCP